MKKFLFLLFLLTGCGFSPLYTSVQNQLPPDLQIEVNPIANQYGSSMRRTIQNQMPQPTEPIQKRYILSVQAPTFTGNDQTITNNDFASMIQVSARTSFDLQDIKHKTLLSRSVSAVSSYSVVNSPYATIVAQQKVHQELSEELAHQIVIDVLTYLAKEHQ